MLSRAFRKFRVAAELRRIRRHVPFCRIAEAIGYSKHAVYAWLNDDRAAPTPEQFRDVMEWAKDWTRHHDAKQAPAASGRSRNAAMRPNGKRFDHAPN